MFLINSQQRKILIEFGGIFSDRQGSLVKTLQLATLLGTKVWGETVVEQRFEELLYILSGRIKHSFSSIELESFASEEM